MRVIVAMLAAALLLASGGVVQAQPEPASDDMVLLPAGSYVPAFARQSARAGTAPLPDRPVRVDVFRLDRYPVTNGQFLEFVRQHPDWRKSRVKALFADQHYLERWQSDLDGGGERRARQPVTSVSWFAAHAYCVSQGKDLPTTDQWEYALSDRGRNQEEVKTAALAWYGRPNPQTLPDVETASANGLGVHGLVGLVWEWTLDFQNALPGSDLRNGGDKGGGQFCGGASFGAKDASDYAAFMRYSLRSSLKAAYTTENLGFRCASRAP